MNKRVVTKEELNWLFTSPACDWSVDNYRGGHCAIGKFMQLGIMGGWKHSISAINNYDYREGIIDCYLWSIATDNGATMKRTYLPTDEAWPKHERAIKIALQDLLEEGIIEIEDEAAREFNLLNKQELAEVK